MLLTPGHLSLPQLRQIARERLTLELDPQSFPAIDACAGAVAAIAARGEPAYGINTGFGRLASTHIPHDQLELLQRNLVLSHAVGVGAPMAAPVVRLMLALKLSSLGRGHSGIRREVMQALLTLFNADVLPLIPMKGSVGASGDLAPLAHMSAVLLGVGEVLLQGKRASALEGLRAAGLEPLTLQAKEGLALLNGTQASTALALYHLFAIEDLYRTGLVAGALSVDAAAGSVAPFDERIHALRGHAGQIAAASAYRTLLEGSQINLSHRGCDKVQDPYSLRCQPQVMGACLDQMRHAAGVLLLEANAVSDNPLIFPDTGEVLSGGNFHAEPVAFAADNLALAVAEIGALAERRIALLIDTTLSGLPPFLVKDGGVNSGFMIAHVTAAALASENKTLAHPASVDSLPTSANQEDHVSMATFAARKLGDIAENVACILAIELLAAAQGVDLRAPHQTSPRLGEVMKTIRAEVAHYALDHYFAPDIEAMARLVQRGVIAAHSPLRLASEEAHDAAAGEPAPGMPRSA
ncbi:histidine ammonia-lyase [Paraburkholderia hayleyella]|uniref:histidine ammonia-lyase n=1 Tax=Paraburkholderia hayleyella TaxID=2152889 RepID=UPI00129218F0|nr:histidine ammonia-lyase [Paraburkholderia hayleyella]